MYDDLHDDEDKSASAPGTFRLPTRLPCLLKFVWKSVRRIVETSPLLTMGGMNSRRSHTHLYTTHSKTKKMDEAHHNEVDGKGERWRVYKRRISSNMEARG